ncbi:MAG TPA: hypothetical protein VK177_06245 [Flavobacteriales bacterium]|nr:hypothetical protein [Flavobacteriales bacterium]
MQTRNCLILLFFLIDINLKSQVPEPRLFYNLVTIPNDEGESWYWLDIILLSENHVFHFSLVNEENNCHCYYNGSKPVKNNLKYALKMIKKRKLGVESNQYFNLIESSNSIRIKTSIDSNAIDTSQTGKMFLTEKNLVLVETTKYMGNNKVVYSDKNGVFGTHVYEEFSRRKTKKWFKQIEKTL